ncbi:SPASM domain-containing protein [Campylobacter sp. MIT 21-1685]|uniref:radical SAM/SPASM domain-containing protein n=1 Tax=unclassified Campylobacter TaxID=2593542 RepID=UPI00224AD846|nr:MULTISPECIES: SPASM domain-containing protein [unclassified Campylobacter]MCX2682651.1 SPASM domain-containing protein [Campylobacter sp. MIT 21-1684]MCX2750931.1 SPASM domain-containing protein [Campylobacter sp. MIT 21-1682]MCX2807136.1 SPASM domain-containing protein [Campylobacter sp. MIT 21-1685]
MKKIYIELSDKCGLKCTFCPSKKELRGIMSLEKFSILCAQIWDKAELFTFHILGDPLLLNNLEEYIQIAKNHRMKLELTTSGFYLNPKNHTLLLKFDNIYQINISLMAFLSQKNTSIQQYFNPILKLCKAHLEQKNQAFINLRLWNLNQEYQAPKENEIIYAILSSHFQVQIQPDTLKRKLARKIILHQKRLFEWPNPKHKNKNEQGYCHALKEQIGILSDGTLVPCCFDTQGDINLGNVFKEDFSVLLHSPFLQNIKEDFRQGKRKEALCQSCEFHKNKA